MRNRMESVYRFHSNQSIARNAFSTVLALLLNVFQSFLVTLVRVNALNLTLFTFKVHIRFIIKSHPVSVVHYYLLVVLRNF